MPKTPVEQVARLATAHAERGYDYSRVVYVNAVTNVEVICAKHGSFWQTPSNHVRGNGCPSCSKESKHANSFKRRCKDTGIDYWRALKRREAGMPEEKIFAEEYVRSQKTTSTAVMVRGVFYPNIRMACAALDPPADERTIARWIRRGMTAEEAFVRVPNPGYRNGIIYCITHVPSGRRYVGLTVQSLERRWTFHREQASAGCIKDGASLHAAIRDFGTDQFDAKKIDSGTTKKDLEAKERQWIERYQAMAPSGFNLNSGGVSGGSNAKPVKWGGKKFESVGAAAEQIAAAKGISLHAAKKRLAVGRVDVRTPARPGESVVKTKAYKAWSAIIHAAINPKSKDYLPGIAVHEPWRQFDDFHADVGDPIEENMCFARLDKSRDFTPVNCRWMTKSEASKINAAYMKATGRLTGRTARSRLVKTPNC